MWNSASTGFKFRRLLAIAVAAWLLIPLSSYVAQAQGEKPYSKEDMLRGLNIIVNAKLEERKDAAKRLSDLVQQRGVNFDLTKEDEKDLPAVGRKAGEDPELIEIISSLIETIRNNYRSDRDAANRFYKKGLEDEGSGDFKNAAEAYKNAIQHDRRFHEAFWRLGAAHLQLGEAKEAEDAFKNAIRLKPDYIEAYYSLALLHNAAGHYEEAIALLKRAVEINSKYPDVYYLLGAVYVNLGRYKEALEPFEKAIEYKTSLRADARFNLGFSYFKSGRKTEALEQYEFLKELDKERAEALYKIIKP